jgi:hypothetical protein
MLLTISGLRAEMHLIDGENKPSALDLIDCKSILRLL